MTQGFGAKIAMQLTKVSRMQLQHWDSIGLAQPSVKVGAGKGSRRAYSFKDLVALKVAKRLREEGLSLQKIRAAVAYLGQNFPDVKAPLSELRFFTNGLDLFVITDQKDVMLDCLKRQLVFSFAIGEFIEGLRGDVVEFQNPKSIAFTVRDRGFTAMLTPDIEDGGYVVTCKEIPAAISQGETVQEAVDNIADAVELCLDHYYESARPAAVVS